MSITRVRRLFSILVIPVSIFVVQSHSIPFWKGILDYHTGIAWIDWAPGIIASVSLELLSIWRWLSRDRRWFAVAVTICLVTGPVVQTATPLWNELTAKTVSTEEVKEAEADVKYYEDLIESGRRGWQDDLRTARERLREVRKASKTEITNVGATAIKSGQTIVLLILLTLGIVMALDSLSSDFGSLMAARDGILRQIGDGRSLDAIGKRFNVSLAVLKRVITGGQVSEAWLQELVRRFDNVHRESSQGDDTNTSNTTRT